MRPWSRMAEDTGKCAGDGQCPESGGVGGAVLKRFAAEVGDADGGGRLRPVVDDGGVVMLQRSMLTADKTRHGVV